VSFARFVQALNREQQDVTYAIPVSAKTRAEELGETMSLEARPKRDTVSGYVIYEIAKDTVYIPENDST
jgi:hypothetical protein